MGDVVSARFVFQNQHESHEMKRSRQTPLTHSTDEYHLTTVQIEGTQNSERSFKVDMDTPFLNQTCPILVVDA